MPCNAASRPKIRRIISSRIMAASPPIAAPPASASALDGGTAYSGAVVTRFYDPMLEKVTAWAPTLGRGDRAHGPRPARISHPRRGRPICLSRSVLSHPEISRQTNIRRASSTRHPTFPFDAARDRATQASHLYRRCDVNGHPGRQGPGQAASRGARRMPRVCRKLGAGHADLLRSWGRRISPMDAIRSKC